jgi:hypothetical protein
MNSPPITLSPHHHSHSTPIAFGCSLLMPPSPSSCDRLLHFITASYLNFTTAYLSPYLIPPVGWLHHHSNLCGLDVSGLNRIDSIVWLALCSFEFALRTKKVEEVTNYWFYEPSKIENPVDSRFALTPDERHQFWIQSKKRYGGAVLKSDSFHLHYFILQFIKHFKRIRRGLITMRTNWSQRTDQRYTHMLR